MRESLLIGDRCRFWGVAKLGAKFGGKGLGRIDWFENGTQEVLCEHAKQHAYEAGERGKGNDSSRVRRVRGLAKVVCRMYVEFHFRVSWRISKQIVHSRDHPIPSVAGSILLLLCLMHVHNNNDEEDTLLLNYGRRK